MTVIRINECYGELSGSLAVEGPVAVLAAGIWYRCVLACTSLPAGLSTDDVRGVKPYRGGCAFDGTERVFVVALWEGITVDWLTGSRRSERGAVGLYLHSGWSRASLRPAWMCREIPRMMSTTTIDTKV
jgi:hypothetical protein